MTTGIEPTPCRSCTRRNISQPSTCGIITSSRIRSGASSSRAARPVFRVRRFPDRVALHLEVDANDLAHLRVVVDEQHEWAAGRLPRA